jgi:tetratricopeptide (TPR) repeat protein
MMFAIGKYELAAALFAAGSFTGAECTAIKARDLFLQEDGPDSPDAANVSNLLSRIAAARGQYARSGEHACAAWEIMERLGSRCTGVEAEAIRVEALGNAGTALRSQGLYAEAEPLLKRAIEHAQENRLSATSHLNDLAVLYKYAGRFDEAERLYRRALAETSGDDAAAAAIYHNLGGLNHSRWEFSAAEPFARRALHIRERLLPRHTCRRLRSRGSARRPGALRGVGTDLPACAGGVYVDVRREPSGGGRESEQPRGTSLGARGWRGSGISVSSFAPHQARIAGRRPSRHSADAAQLRIDALRSRKTRRGPQYGVQRTARF